MPLPAIDPPVLNTACPWASTTEDLQALFDSPFTGAVTIRTSLLDGFLHDPAIHQFAFFHTDDHRTATQLADGTGTAASYGGSLNTVGYSPTTLQEYLDMIPIIVERAKLPQDQRHTKPFIISVTGDPDAIVECYRRIHGLQQQVANPLCMEINLSCPNIPSKPPPAYSGKSLAEYLEGLGSFTVGADERRVAWGIKAPPYTYHNQFQMLIHTLREANSGKNTIDFITSTNTLGSSLVLNEANVSPVLSSASGLGIGGMAGTPLHPLALGNVRTIRSMLDKYEELASVKLIGVGGVSDRAGFLRMRAVGAHVVGVATAFGRSGVGVFKNLADTI